MDNIEKLFEEMVSGEEPATEEATTETGANIDALFTAVLDKLDAIASLLAPKEETETPAEETPAEEKNESEED